MVHHYCNETLFGYTDQGNQPIVDLFSQRHTFLRYISNLKFPLHSPSDLEELILKTSLFLLNKTKRECFINS